LLTGLATSGDRVYPGRVSPIPAEDLPALRLYVDDEAIELGTASVPMQLARTTSVRVEAVAALLDGLDDTLDAMADEIETAIAGDDTLGGLLNEPLRLVAIEPDRTASADKPHGQITLTFAAHYETEAGSPDVAL